MSRRAQDAERAAHAARQRVLRDEAPCFRLAHENRRAGVLQRSNPVQDEVVELDARTRSARQREPAEAETSRRKYLDALAPVRRICHDERAVRLDRERRGIDDASGFGADLHDLPHARPLLVDAVHRVRTPVESEVLPGSRLIVPDNQAVTPEIRMVEHVEELRPELQLLAFGNPEVLEQ